MLLFVLGKKLDFKEPVNLLDYRAKVGKIETPKQRPQDVGLVEHVIVGVLGVVIFL